LGAELGSSLVPVRNFWAAACSEAHYCFDSAAAHIKLSGEDCWWTGFAGFIRKSACTRYFAGEPAITAETNLISSISNVENLACSISREARFVAAS